MKTVLLLSLLGLLSGALTHAMVLISDEPPRTQISTEDLMSHALALLTLCGADDDTVNYIGHSDAVMLIYAAAQDHANNDPENTLTKQMVHKIILQVYAAKLNNRR